MKKVFTLVIDENNEPIIVEEDVILEDILNSLASISKRIDDRWYTAGSNKKWWCWYIIKFRYFQNWLLMYKETWGKICPTSFDN